MGKGMGRGNTARNLAEFVKNPTGFSGLFLYYTDIEPCDLKVLVKEFIKYQNLKKIKLLNNTAFRRLLIGLMGMLSFNQSW